MVLILLSLTGCTTLINALVVGYEDPLHGKVAAAGILEKQARVGEVRFNYAESPDNGPPLLLLNAQHMDWFSYGKVLVELSKSFHVFAVDYPGHGKTSYPEDYPMNAGRIGSDLARFVEEVIREPAFVTGNSSGGLLTTWLAAYRPQLVKAIVLEDPPLFSSEYPRIKETISYRSFTHCANFLEEGGDDFLIYWLESSAQFISNFAGPGVLPKLIGAIEAYREANPGKAVEIRFLPETVRMLVRGMDNYDPRFGAAFHDGSWNADFDHAEAIARISCPVLLIHANFEVMENGILNGAMDQEEAEEVLALLQDGTYVRVDSEHVVHEDRPKEFIRLVEGFLL